MKKNYLQPTMRVVVLKHKCHILTVSNRNFSTMSSNLDDLDYGEGSDQEAR